MGNFRYRIAQFLIGRNGFDAFCRGLLFLAMILIIADIFIPGHVLRSIGLALLIYSYFRAFSRNIGRRQAENAWYVSCVKAPFHSYMSRDRKHYRYFKCPSLIKKPCSTVIDGFPRFWPYSMALFFYTVIHSLLMIKTSQTEARAGSAGIWPG